MRCPCATYPAVLAVLLMAATNLLDADVNAAMIRAEAVKRTESWGRGSISSHFTKTRNSKRRKKHKSTL
jgi:hypothetical protein